MDYKFLKERHRAERSEFPQGLSVRVHRALSWLKRSEQESEDQDAKFLFLWIAFNSAYAQEEIGNYSSNERSKQSLYWEKLIGLDDEKRIYNLVWGEFSNSIRLFKDNHYIFGPFWEFQKGHISEKEWSDKFAKANKKISHALVTENTLDLLSLIFDRLYMLRNQLIHGGATWNGKVNREQIEVSTKLLALFVPVMVSIMMDHPKTLWGDETFPVVDS